MKCNNPRCAVMDNSRPYGLCDTCYFRPEIARVFRQWYDGKRPCGLHALRQPCTCPWSDEQKQIYEAMLVRHFAITELAQPQDVPVFNVNLDKIDNGIQVVMTPDKKIIGIFGAGVDMARVLRAAFTDAQRPLSEEELAKVRQIQDDLAAKTKGLPPIDYTNLARPHTEEELDQLDDTTKGDILRNGWLDERTVRDKHTEQVEQQLQQTLYSIKQQMEEKLRQLGIP